MTERADNRAWWLVLPAIALSLAIVLPPALHLFERASHGGGALGVGVFLEMLADRSLQDAFIRQLAFTIAALSIELPLGAALAACLPRKGALAGWLLCLLALPLAAPFAAVGLSWGLFADPAFGPLARWLEQSLGALLDPASDPAHAWIVLLAMDVWHWTPLVAILVHAGLAATPEARLRAAELDGASRLAVFRHVVWPQIEAALAIAFALRLFDSFAIWVEVELATQGGPGVSTSLLSAWLLDPERGAIGAAASSVLLIAALSIALALAKALRGGEGRRA